jgi:hypothetical protein
VKYFDGDFPPSSHHEFCWVDTVGEPGNWFLITPS